MFCTYKGDKHLSIFRSFIRSYFRHQGSPTIIWVSRSWGLPRFIIWFPKYSFLWHFTTYNLLRFLVAVSFKLLRVIYSPYMNTTIITDSASMDFPLHYIKCSVCLLLFFFSVYNLF